MHLATEMCEEEGILVSKPYNPFIDIRSSDSKKATNAWKLDLLRKIRERVKKVLALSLAHGVNSHRLEAADLRILRTRGSSAGRGDLSAAAAYVGRIPFWSTPNGTCGVM